MHSVYRAQRIFDDVVIYGALVANGGKKYIMQSQDIEVEIYDTYDESAKITCICYQVKPETIVELTEVK
jgi:hypothetical protein